MITLNDLLFDVNKEKNPAITNSEYSHIIKGNVNGQIMDLNYCSDRYKLIPNDLIFPRIESELQERGYKFTKSYHMVDNVRFYSSYILEDKNLAIGNNNDIVKPMIQVNHSYNGLTKYSITFGYFRLVCSNGMVIPLEGHEDKNLRISGKHTKEILNSLNSLWTKMDYFFNIQPTIKKRFEVLTDRIIPNYVDRIEAVLNATSLKPRKTQLEDINNTILKESKDLNSPINDWLIYNGINAYIFKSVDAKGNKSKALPEKKRESDSKVLNYMLTNA